MEISELVEKSKEIRETSKNSRRLRWPSEFRDEVVTMVKSGTSISKISNSTGIAHQTIRGWVGPKPKANKFRELRIEDQVSVTGLTLSWGGDLEVSGLSFSQFRELLREGLL